VKYIERPGKPVLSYGQRIETVELVPLPDKQTRPSKKSGDLHIGCPVWWLRCIQPVLKTGNQIIVGIYVWRRWVVCKKQETFTVPNGELKNWGISRQIKYRTINRLVAAGLIKKVRPHNSHEKMGEDKTAITLMIRVTKPKG
jgi:hypothetical protein